MNGALANLPNNRNQPFSYNLIGQRSNVVPTFSSGRKFQDYIGTSALPTFKYVESIITGQRQYNPNSAEDRAYMQDYASWKSSNPDVAGAPSVGDLTGLASQIGESIGSSLITGGDVSEGFKGLFGKTGMDVAKGTTTFPISALRANEQSYDALVNAGLSDGSIITDKIPPGIDVDKLKGITGRSELLAKGVPEGFGGFKARLTATQQLKGAAGGAIGNFAVQLALGRDPVKAAKSAGAGAIGKILGNAIFPGFGGFIGGTLGSIIGGRVICNELMKQGLMTKEDVLMDYKFTRDYLTPQHVNGYHMWAVWVVKKMRQGEMVKFWKHIAKHRANEIAYIYGKKDKPDYLGKIYRKVGESVCWLLGGFAKATDWSVLYKEKEI